MATRPEKWLVKTSAGLGREFDNQPAAQGLYHLLTLPRPEGSCPGWVSLSCNGVIVKHWQTPGWVRTATGMRKDEEP